MAYVPEFSIGATLSRAVEMFRRNLLPLGGCIALVAVIGLVLQVIATVAFSGGLGAEAGAPNPLGSVSTFLITLATAAFTSAVNGHAAELELNGEKASFSSAWNTGWRNWLPQVGLLLLLWIMLLFGWSFFLVPGAILGVMFGAAPAAQVAERCGVFAAFGHSFRAGRGNGWALFGYYVVAFILATVVFFALYLLMMAVVFGLLAGSRGDAGGSLAVMAVTALIGIPIYLFLAGAIPLMLGSIPAAAYVSLRKAQGERAVSSVFD